MPDVLYQPHGLDALSFVCIIVVKDHRVAEKKDNVRLLNLKTSDKQLKQNNAKKPIANIDEFSKKPFYLM